MPTCHLNMPTEFEFRFFKNLIQKVCIKWLSIKFNQQKTHKKLDNFNYIKYKK
jgi:hypothetical protein